MSANVDLDTRVARLEREARIWRVAAVLSMLIAGVAWMAPSASAQGQAFKADTIYARSIYVVPDLANTSSAASTGISLQATSTGNFLYVSSPQNTGGLASTAVSLHADGGQASLSVSNQVANVQLLAAGGASVSASGSTSTVSLFGPVPGGPSLFAGVNTQNARVDTLDGSNGTASMGFQPGVPGAFRAYDPAVSQTDPVWTAP
jgi:hypothetical protein